MSRTVKWRASFSLTRPKYTLRRVSSDSVRAAQRARAPCCPSVAVLPQLVGLADGTSQAASNPLPHPAAVVGTGGDAAADGRRCKFAEDWGKDPARAAAVEHFGFCVQTRLDVLWLLDFFFLEVSTDKDVYMRRVFTCLLIGIYLFPSYILRSRSNDPVCQALISRFWSPTATHQTPKWSAHNHIRSILNHPHRIWLVCYLSSIANQLKLYSFHKEKLAIKNEIPLILKLSLCFQTSTSDTVFESRKDL